MKNLFHAGKFLLLDMASTFFFLALYLWTNNIPLSVALGVALGISSVHFTATRQDGASLIPLPGRCSRRKPMVMIWRAAPSMSCAASQTIQSSQPTAMFCTRSA
jgi:hypothetical protein